MAKIRKRYTRDFKVKIFKESIVGSKSLTQLSSEHGVHVNQIKEWKKQGMEALSERFSQRRGRKKEEESVSRLYEEIGRLKVERDFLSSKLGN